MPKRIAIGVALAGVAVAVTLAGGVVFAGFVWLAGVAAAREWHRMVGGARYRNAWLATSAALLGAIALSYLSLSASLPFAVLCLGATLAAALGSLAGAPARWSIVAAFYIGIPSCCLVALRQHEAHAYWLLFGVFIAVWSADTGAMAVGQIVGGPKLFPVLSPNKTWSGLIGGLVVPGTMLAIYVAALGGNPSAGFAMGLLLAAAGHAGDLFESWVKRRMGRKDSGESLPGHGGVLDRIDSLLFVAPLAALLLFHFGAARLFGVPA